METIFKRVWESSKRVSFFDKTIYFVVINSAIDNLIYKGGGH